MEPNEKLVMSNWSLNAAERGNTLLLKEAMDIVFGEKKFIQFLYGQKFTIQTDHKP